MNNFREQYKKDATVFPVSDNLVRRTARRMSNPKSMQAKRSARVLVAVLAFVILSCTTVFAGVGYYIKYQFDKTPYDSHISTNANDFQKQKITKGNVCITVNNVVISKDAMYVSFDFETIDKTPLQKSTDTEKSNLFRQGFKQSYIECDGKKYNVFLQRKDTATIPNKATFEAEIIGIANQSDDLNTKLDLTELIGKEATLVLKDLIDDVSVNEDIGFTLNSLADITKQGPPCTDFIVTGKYIEYADGTSTDSYTLPAGKYKIPFSSKYPKAYIDNYGFKKSGEISSGEYFYLSITPSSEAERIAFRKLAFQSKTTGNHWNGYGTAWGDPDKNANNAKPFDISNFKSKIAFDGDRIVIALSGWQYNESDVTPKDLSDLILVTGLKNTSPLLQAGSWRVPFIAKEKAKERVFKIDQTIKENYIDTITVTPLTMTITGSCNYNVDKNGDFYNFRLLMKDGSEISYSYKLDGWFDKDGLTFKFNKEIDLNDVVGIKMWGKEIPLKQ
ncbi:hypothetical protein RBG61_12380 [Paludicola sp. MB14-C6]|uniref:hypothetical protein n=1 Tax=Paludihabitans sp. MB14-C6 TaxID=3070656 RepID=UPI0027DDD5AA|nr:hypothetical protein [Paludicola sp. MB14-C6]WMJ22777.1 hypothetical protein RBG61_12380 [Paludicola sp. MB14-C6]